VGFSDRKIGGKPAKLIREHDRMIKDDERKIATLKTRKSEENSEKLAFFGIADQDRDACRCDGGTSRGIPTMDRPANGERRDTATDRHFGSRNRTLAMTAMQLAGACHFRARRGWEPFIQCGDWRDSALCAFHADHDGRERPTRAWRPVRSEIRSSSPTESSGRLAISCGKL
jgi:hypothetical protein